MYNTCADPDSNSSETSRQPNAAQSARTRRLVGLPHPDHVKEAV